MARPATDDRLRARPAGWQEQGGCGGAADGGDGQGHRLGPADPADGAGGEQRAGEGHGQRDRGVSRADPADQVLGCGPLDGGLLQLKERAGGEAGEREGAGGGPERPPGQEPGESGGDEAQRCARAGPKPGALSRGPSGHGADQ